MPVFRSSLNDYDQMPFGKWKGELLMDVPHGYFRWLREQDWLKDHPSLSKYVLGRDWGEDDDEEDEEFSPDNLRE